MTSFHLHDLAAQVVEVRKVEADACIVGGGAAGLYLARRLRQQGLRVVVLEAGGREGADPAASGFSVEEGVSTYAGATVGRSFGLGGSTSRWGGVLAVPLQSDIAGPKTEQSSWREVLVHVDANASAVLAELGYPGAAEFSNVATHRLGAAAKLLEREGLQGMAALTLPFTRKNLAHLVGLGHGAGDGADLFLHAEATVWTLTEQDGKACVSGVEARSPNGRRLHVRAARTVVAAGALESARILLEIDALADRRILAPQSATGCFLSDHLSASIAEVEPAGRPLARRLFAPGFDGAWMRPVRIVDTDVARTGFRAFSHIVFEDHGSGFAVARDALRALQRGERPSVAAGSLLKAASGLARLGWSRYARRRLYVAGNSAAHLQLDIEQTPCRENRLSLLPPDREGGRPRLKVDWAVRASDEERLRLGAQRFLGAWRSVGPALPALRELDLGDGRSKPHDAYHPVGVCRLGSDPEATVNSQLRVQGFANLHVLSTGVLPTAGSANPTFTLLCLAHALASGWHALEK